SADSFDGTLRRFLELIHPEDHVRLAQGVEVALGRGGLYEVEFRALLPDASTRWLGERGRVLQDGQGQLTRIVGIVQDISERKATEEALLVQALHDPLTGLPNRIPFARARRPDGQPATRRQSLSLHGVGPG